MIDLVKLKLQAGDGGDGRVSFRREKYVPKGGPDGGSGGKGGNIILRGTSAQSTLQNFVGIKEFAAEDGEDGQKKKMSGAKGQDLVIEVPLGTTVWLLAENKTSKIRRERYPLHYTLSRNEVDAQMYSVEKEGEGIPLRPEQEIEPILTEEQVEKLAAVRTLESQELINLKRQARLLKKLLRRQSEQLREIDFKALPKQKIVEITEEGQEVVICQGGFGGRGNETFKGPANTTPMEAQYGSPGEVKVVVLEQQLLADVGLVGLPNAGKSTLVSVLTDARPKVADYPFTTLEPHLGVMQLDPDAARQQDKREIVIADIPGLIEGASEGKGLGHTFLRHLEHCRTLIYVLYLPEEILFQTDLSIEERVAYLRQQFLELQHELKNYEPLLIEKPYLIALNKIDLYPAELRAAAQDLFKSHDEQLLLISAATKEGIATLRKSL